MNGIFPAPLHLPYYVKFLSPFVYKEAAAVKSYQLLYYQKTEKALTV